MRCSEGQDEQKAEGEIPSSSVSSTESMAKPKKDQLREERIDNEVVVDPDPVRL